MANVARSELVIEGYRADITKGVTVVHATGRGYHQRDDRAYEVALNIPTEDLRRVAGLILDAATAAEAMVQG